MSFCVAWGIDAPPESFTVVIWDLSGRASKGRCNRVITQVQFPVAAQISAMLRPRLPKLP
jgi:hypothetical protein